MANTNIIMRIDENLKVQLQELMSNLGMDMTTFFTLAAKQAVREQALPFWPRLIDGKYEERAYYMKHYGEKYLPLYTCDSNKSKNQFCDYKPQNCLTFVPFAILK